MKRETKLQALLSTDQRASRTFRFLTTLVKNTISLYSYHSTGYYIRVDTVRLTDREMYELDIAAPGENILSSKVSVLQIRTTLLLRQY